MSSLYERLMAAKGAPQAAEAPNSTQLRKAPMNLRSAMSKYAEGGDVEGNNAGVDFAKAAQSGAPFDSLMQAVMAAAQQAQQTTTPFSDPIPYSPGKGGRGIPTPYPPPEDPGFYQPPVDSFPEPSYEDIMPVLPRVYDDLTPVPPPEVYPQYPTDPGFYQPPTGYIPLPGPYPEYPSDPGIIQPIEPVYNPFLKRGGDDLKKLIEDIISNKGTGNLLENQRKLMSLLEVLKGK